MTKEEIESKRRKIDETAPDLHIFDLNDDCLERIVSFVEFKDMLVLQEVHRRFHTAISANVMYHEIEIASVNFNQMRNFLVKFGEKVRKIAVSIPIGNEIKELMSKYCNTAKVQGCKFKGPCCIDEDFIEINCIFFKALKSLELNRVGLSSQVLHRILDTTTSLEHFSLNDVEAIDSLPHLLSKFQLLQLKSLFLFYVYPLTIETGNLPKVDSLKSLTVVVDAKVVPIVTCFPNLENLSFQYEDMLETYSMEPVIRFANLKRLELKLFEIAEEELYSLLKHMANQITLDELVLDVWRVHDEIYGSLHYQDYDRIIDALSRFVNLKSLVLRTKWRFGLRLVNLMKPLIKLRCLTIGVYELDFLELTGIEQLVCEIVKSAKNLSKISLQAELLDQPSDDDYHRFYQKLFMTNAKLTDKRVFTVQIADQMRTNGCLYIERKNAMILEVRPVRKHPKLFRCSGNSINFEMFPKIAGSPRLFE